jgi:hypothetical protein
MQQRSEDTAVGDRKGAAAQVLEREAAVVGARREVANRQLDLGERQAIGVANHRHHEAALGAHGHPDVEVALEDDLVALNFGIQLRERPQRGNR